jgi:hypothetical protein
MNDERSRLFIGGISIIDYLFSQPDLTVSDEHKEILPISRLNSISTVQ